MNRKQAHGWLQKLAILLALAPLLSATLAPLSNTAAAAPAGHSMGTASVIVQPGSADRFYKVQIGASGIYKITYQALADAGLPVASVSLPTFQLFEQGVEVGRQVVDADIDQHQIGVVVKHVALQAFPRVGARIAADHVILGATPDENAIVVIGQLKFSGDVGADRVSCDSVSGRADIGDDNALRPVAADQVAFSCFIAPDDVE